MEKVEVDITIIGAGAVGLFCAREISRLYPELEFVILEKNPYIADETTGRNSGVLHAGIYYPKDSLKHQMCLEGNRLWRELPQSESFPVNNCQKYIVANDEQALEKLYSHALANEVPELRKLSSEEIDKLSNYCHLNCGFLSGTTGIIDIPEAMKLIETELFNKNIPLLKNSRVSQINKNEFFEIKYNDELIHSRILINAAGLFAVDIRKLLGLNELENKFVKGNYLKLNKKFFNESLIYPLPEADLKGLGVHSTIDFQGAVRFGPNTEDIPANPEEINYALNESLLDEMFPAIAKTFKGIAKEDLSLDYSGVRPKILKDGKLFEDFYIKAHSGELAGYIEFCGIESPGLTAAPALAKWAGHAVAQFLN